MNKIPYTIRYSDKAQSLILRINVKGLEVVVPKKLKNVSQSKIDAFVQLKQAWIEKHSHYLFSTQKVIALPQTISLLSIGIDWQVVYENTSSARVSLNADSNQKMLCIRGDLTQTTACLKLLRSWVMQQANFYLPAWLLQISMECGLSYNKVSIRNNKTRLGSCSSNKTISLSCQLLFFPFKYVRYVILHELCHTKKMHHGSSFWALLKRYDVDAISHAKDAKRFASQIPAWVIG